MPSTMDERADARAHERSPQTDLDAARSSRRRLGRAALLFGSALLVLKVAACESTGVPATIDVTVNGRTFTCRVAADDPTRQKGLGGVASLGPDEGMMFAFPEAQLRNFWMVGCIMDIDIAFTDQLGMVTAVHTMPKEEPQREGESTYEYEARLKRYSSVAPAQYALEVAPGTLQSLGVQRGTRLEFDRNLLKRLAK